MQQVIEVGTTFLFECRDPYENSFFGSFIATKQIDVVELFEEHYKKNGRYCVGPDSFFCFLEEGGYMVPDPQAVTLSFKTTDAFPEVY